ncbi:vWA domain-containing protein [Cellulomonas marina]|uniref:Ca-activated chloride channel family protein n=1 Tax=Cellulomonas marina TaxID=988821 RepID=A0A1I1AHP2_9CELL|nr:VWA domain-containing protein [Cellulomonas marina]GIG30216.1 hypothetical protein Cma02nite_28160 [Cellulomonas marina]SFB36866.1 Ca-activated chloride channel family protein [Cellulomonas marina]
MGNGRLQLDVVALDQGDEVTVLVDVTAPVPDGTVERAPVMVVVALDRSASMSGRRMRAARDALVDLVGRLRPGDRFGLVTFDDEALLVVPAEPVTDPASVVEVIEDIVVGGGTDVSAGLLRGLQEVRRVSSGGPAHLVVLSDGHATRGLTSPALLGGLVGRHAQHGVTTSTLGLGLGYDEGLLGAVARAGGGQELFAEHAAEAGPLLARVLDRATEQVVVGAVLRVRRAQGVVDLVVADELPVHTVDDGLLVELGGLTAGETRSVVLTATRGRRGTGPGTEVAHLELRGAVLPGLEEDEQTRTVRLGEVATDPSVAARVRRELLHRDTQSAKRRAAAHLADGDVDAATAVLGSALTELRTVVGAPDPGRELDDLRSEGERLARFIDEAVQGSTSRAAKGLRADAAEGARGATGSSSPTARGRTTGRSG